MDRMLHRGEYAIAEEKALEPAKPAKAGWSKIIGIDEHFTPGDKLLASGLFGWTMLWLSVFLIGTAWNLIAPWPIQVWSQFWFVVGIGIPIVFTLITAVWFSWGGIHDMREFFRRLRGQRINHLDDGTVVDHHNLADETPKSRA